MLVHCEAFPFLPVLILLGLKVSVNWGRAYGEEGKSSGNPKKKKEKEKEWIPRKFLQVFLFIVVSTQAQVEAAMMQVSTSQEPSIPSQLVAGTQKMNGNVLNFILLSEL